MSLKMEARCESPVTYRDGISVAIPTSLSLNGSGGGLDGGYMRQTKSFENGLAPSSPDTSCCSTPVRDVIVENGNSSGEEGPDEYQEEIDEFVKNYVEWLFSTERDISYEDKAKFGELTKDVSARMSFAKYIDAQRNRMKCVDESIFYKLLHSFALVLFECGEADDYMPGKSLMNMAFTYYYIPDQRMVTADSFSSEENVSLNSTNGRSKSESETVSPKRKSIIDRFKKEVEACKQVFQDTPSFQELKQGFFQSRKSKKEKQNESPTASLSRSASEGSSVTIPDLYSPCCKNFLYEHLKNQVIWKSLRFWNAAFFSAVHAERKRRCIQKEWTALSQDEQESTNDAVVNITFGQLGTFINNMKCLGLDKKTCYEFLRKQSVIGGIEEDGQYYQMLVEQIEDDCTF